MKNWASGIAHFGNSQKEAVALYIATSLSGKGIAMVCSTKTEDGGATFEFRSLIGRHLVITFREDTGNPHYWAALEGEVTRGAGCLSRPGEGLYALARWAAGDDDSLPDHDSGVIVGNGVHQI